MRKTMFLSLALMLVLSAITIVQRVNASCARLQANCQFTVVNSACGSQPCPNCGNCCYAEWGPCNDLMGETGWSQICGGLCETGGGGDV